jgi:hypothetical protein
MHTIMHAASTRKKAKKGEITDESDGICKHGAHNFSLRARAVYKSPLGVRPSETPGRLGKRASYD